MSSPKVLFAILAAVMVLYFVAMPSAFPSVDDSSPSSSASDSNSASHSTNQHNSDNFIIVLDAGSSGTRVHLYRWSAASNVSSPPLPHISEVFIQGKLPFKTTPGLSSFADSSSRFLMSDIIAYVKPLMKPILEVMPKQLRNRTPLYLSATAGMRLIEEKDRIKIMAAFCEAITPYNFIFSCEQARVIPGEEEGFLGWLAANYLSNSLSSKSNGNEPSTAGFLDMGGASAQIAFQTSAQQISSKNSFTVTIPRKDNIISKLNVFSTTFLGFGANEARERYLDLLDDSEEDSVVHEDPCLHRGINFHQLSDSKQNLSLTGTGNFSQCLQNMRPLVEAKIECQSNQCSLEGNKITLNPSEFIGVSEFWYTLKAFELDDTFSYTDALSKAIDYCNVPWTEAKEKYKETEDRLVAQCFKTAWILSMLTDGLHFPKEHSHSIDPASTSNHQLRIADKIDNVEVSWTLGTALCHVLECGGIPRARGTHQSSDYFDPTTNNKPNRSIEIFIIIIALIFFIILGFLVLRSTWFANLFVSRNGVQAWLINRNGPHYLSVNSVSGNNGYDLEMGSTASFGQLPRATRSSRLSPFY